MQEEAQQTTSGRSILLVHGGDFKPAEATLLDISLSAIRSGIERDYPDHVGAYDALHKDMAYFGDLTNAFLESLGRQYDEQLDLGDRNNALTALRAVPQVAEVTRYVVGPSVAAHTGAGTFGAVYHPI